MYQQCASNSDCTTSTTQNGVCSSGVCTCGTTGSVCSGTTPACNKATAKTTQAIAGSTDAGCYVCNYFPYFFNHVFQFRYLNAGCDIIFELLFFSAQRLVARNPPTTSALPEHAFVGVLVQHAQGVRHTVSTQLLLEHLHSRENCQPSKIQRVPQNAR